MKKFNNEKALQAAKALQSELNKRFDKELIIETYLFKDNSLASLCLKCTNDESLNKSLKYSISLEKGISEHIHIIESECPLHAGLNLKIEANGEIILELLEPKDLINKIQVYLESEMASKGYDKIELSVNLANYEGFEGVEINKTTYKSEKMRTGFLLTGYDHEVKNLFYSLEPKCKKMIIIADKDHFEIQADQHYPELDINFKNIEKSISEQLKEEMQDKNVDKSMNLLAETFNMDISDKVRTFLEYRYYTKERILWAHLDYLFSFQTYEEMFGIENQGFVPVLIIGSIEGYYIYLILKTGKVYALHHDSVQEYAYDYDNDGQTMDTFLEKFSTAFHFASIDHLIAFSKDIYEKGYKRVSNVPVEILISTIQKTFDLNKHQLVERFETPGFNIFSEGVLDDNIYFED